MEYEVRVLDSSFNLLGIVPVTDISFEFSKFNGCGRFNATLPRRFDNYSDIVDFGNCVQVYIDGVLWYCGFIQDYTNKLGLEESVEIVGMGYIEQLTFDEVTNVYSNIYSADLVKMLVNASIVNNSLDITINDSLVLEPGFKIDQMVFKTIKLKQAVQQVTDLITGWDFGVNENREFYFYPVYSTLSIWDVAKWDVDLWESNKPNHWVFVAKEIESYEPMNSSIQFPVTALLEALGRRKRICC